MKRFLRKISLALLFTGPAFSAYSGMDPGQDFSSEKPLSRCKKIYLQDQDSFV